MIEPGRYTSGRIALANLSASIDSLELRRGRGAAGFADRLVLSDLLFVRGDVLGRMADHHRAELVAYEAIALAPAPATALFTRARLAGRFHRFTEAGQLLEQAFAAGYPKQEIDGENAARLQAIGRHREALILRERLAKDAPGIHTLGTLASLLAEMGEWSAAEDRYAAAIAADESLSPIPCAQLLFEWGVCAMRAGRLDRAEQIFSELEAVLPQHVPSRHRHFKETAHGHH